MSESLKKLSTDGKVNNADITFFNHWGNLYLLDVQLVQDFNFYYIRSLVIEDDADLPRTADYLKLKFI